MNNESFKPRPIHTCVDQRQLPDRRVTTRPTLVRRQLPDRRLTANRRLILGVALAASIALPRAAAAQMSMAGSLPMGAPDLCAMPTVSARATGLWSAPGTWSTNTVPGAGARVAIPSGMRVTYDLLSDTVLNCVGVHGALAYRTTVSSRLVVGTLFVYSDGALEIGTAAAPVAASALAELVIADQALDLLADPAQFGTGLLAFGRVTMHGVPKAATFVRLASEVAPGNTQLSPAAPVVDWAVGDRVIVPDTRHLKTNETKTQFVPQWEERVLTSVSSTVLGVSRGFDFLHEGARNGDGVLEPTMLPHVANISRNVLIRSANPSGTRGHVIAIDRATIDIRYARFFELGRTTIDAADNTTFVDSVATHIGTNQIGRYALHMHHLSGPTTPQANGAQFTLIGNAIEAPRKWGMVIHHSNHGLIQRNVVYNGHGTGVMFEDGSESFNILESNFVLRVEGLGDHNNGFGTEGVGFWFRGTNNFIRKNVAANITSQYDGPYGYTFYQVYGDTMQVPKFQGADVATTTDMQPTDPYTVPIREFSDNEVYGATARGLSIWWVGSYGTDGQRTNMAVTEIKNFHAWHVYDLAYWNYPSHRMLFTGMVVRGKDPAASACCSTGWFGSDYMASDLIIDGADIQGMRVGISLATHSGGTTGGATGATQAVRNSYLRNHTNVFLETPWTSSYRADSLPARTIMFTNVRMGAFDTGWSGSPAGDYVLAYRDGDVRNVSAVDDIKVFDHNGVAGDSFRLFYTEQAPNFIVPQTIANTDGSPKLAASPVAGLTNTQTWSQFGIAVAGAIAPCASTRARMVGAFACGGIPPPPPPPPTLNAPPSVSVTSPSAGNLFTAPATITLKATAADSDGTIARVDYFISTSSTPIGSSTSGPTYAATWNNVAGGTYTVTARATDNGGAITTSAGVPMTVQLVIASPLPAPWLARDIGAVGLAGSTTLAGGLFTMNGSGADIWGTADAFQFVSQPLVGDGQIVARMLSVQNIDPWAKAGVMMREDLTPGARHAMVVVSAGSGVSFQRRTVTGGTSVNLDNPGSAPSWVKLVRTGSTLSAYRSADGATWTLMGTETIAFPGSIYVGLAVTSHNNAALAAATLDTITLGSNIDTTPPTISVTAPLAAATVSGAAVPVSVNAADNVGVVAVQFLLDGVALGAEDTVAPYSVAWNTTTATNASHALTARARDAAGNSTTSVGISVTVSNVVADTTPPTVSMAAPAAGAIVSGAAITVSVNAADNVGVAGVQFLLDGVALGAEDTVAPYSVVWNTTTATNVSHSLTARARDAAGNSTTAAGVSVTVSNVVADTTPPTVSMAAPAAGAIVSGAQVVASVNAADNVGVAGVQFLLDGVALGAEDTVAPYSVVWNTTTATNASHSLTARARDAAGNNTTSVGVSVTVNNAALGSSAVFVRSDSTTQGTWQGVYGLQGYTLAQGTSSLPSYAAVTVTGQAAWTWATSTTVVRALQRPAATDRFAATWYSNMTFSIDVNLTDGLTHQVAVYAIDWDSTTRAERIDVVDAVSGAVLDSRMVTAFNGGQYLVWTLRGHVKLRVTRTAGSNAVLSALMFD